MSNISERLIDKRLVDIDDLLDFLLNKRGLNIGDEYYTDVFEKDLKKAFDEYILMNVPEVKIGQTVWVISKYYSLEEQKLKYKIIKSEVCKITIKSRYNFSVRGEHNYRGTFTKGSIGKTVFFSEEDAKNYLNK